MEAAIDPVRVSPVVGDRRGCKGLVGERLGAVSAALFVLPVFGLRPSTPVFGPGPTDLHVLGDRFADTGTL